MFPRKMTNTYGSEFLQFAVFCIKSILRKYLIFDPDKMQKLITMNTQLIGDSLELRNCALKYNLGHSAKVYSRIENRIKNLKEIDQKFVEEILSQTTDE